MESGGIEVLVDERGDLSSIKKDGVEFMWNDEARSLVGKSHDLNNAWGRSFCKMFPLVGSPLMEGNKGYILLDGVKRAMPQHGFLRDLDVRVDELDEVLEVTQIYFGNELVPTKKGNAFFPRAFQVRDSYSVVANEGVLASYIIYNMDKEILPYSFGVHPAFFMPGDEVRIIAHDVQYTLKDVFESGALLLPGCQKVMCEDGVRQVSVEHDFANTMVWTPKPRAGLRTPHICIEPVTGLPMRTKDGFVGSYDSREVAPDKVCIYSMSITPRIVGGENR